MNVPAQTIAGFLLAVSIFTANLGCQPANEYVPPPTPKVTVARPIQQSVTMYLEETGTTSPYETVDIRARVDGFLEEIKFGPGDDVTAGQELYLIDQKPYQAQVDIATAAVGVAKAELIDADAKYRRNVPLAEKGAVTPEELGESKAAKDVAEASIKAAEANLRQTEIDLGYTVIKSPIDGRVGKTLVDVGNYVGGIGATQLTTVVKYQPIYANFNISERDLLEIRKRMRKAGDREVAKEDVKIFIGQENEDGYPHAGHLDYADLGVDTGTGTFMVRGVFDNEKDVIIPGAFVRIRLPMGQLENALLVPERAFGSDQRGRFLLIVNSKNTVERRDVAVGPKYGGMLVITKGLQNDEQVIIDGLQRARPGAEVDPQTEQLTPPQELLDTKPTAEPGPAETESSSSTEKQPTS